MQGTGTIYQGSELRHNTRRFSEMVYSSVRGEKKRAMIRDARVESYKQRASAQGSWWSIRSAKLEKKVGTSGRASACRYEGIDNCKDSYNVTIVFLTSLYAYANINAKSSLGRCTNKEPSPLLFARTM